MVVGAVYMEWFFEWLLIEEVCQTLCNSQIGRPRVRSAARTVSVIFRPAQRS
jgi:hypothetical protein